MRKLKLDAGDWIIAIYLLVVVAIAVGAVLARAEPAPPPPDCQLLAHAGSEVEVFRCSGAGFYGVCYVAVPTNGMSSTPGFQCGQFKE